MSRRTVDSHFQLKCTRCGYVWFSRGGDSKYIFGGHYYIPHICPKCRAFLRSIKGGTVEVRDLKHDLPLYILEPRASRTDLVKSLGEEELERRVLNPKQRLKLETKTVNDIALGRKKKNLDDSLIDYWAMH